MSTEAIFRRADGFTMLEVLIAMLILSVGLLGLTALGATSARMVARAERQAEYSAAATALMERAAREVRRNRAVPAALLAGTTLADGTQLVLHVDPRDTNGSSATREQFVLTVTAHPAARNSVMRTRDSLKVRTDVYAP